MNWNDSIALDDLANERIALWRKSGFKLLHEGIKWSFTNNNERWSYPCIVEILDDCIVCHGDYDAFVFEMKEEDFMSSDNERFFKCLSDNQKCLAYEWDWKVQEADFENFIKTAKEDGTDIDELQEWIDCNESDMADEHRWPAALDECPVGDAFEVIGSHYGETFDARFVAQLAIFQFIKEAIAKEKKEGQK